VSDTKIEVDDVTKVYRAGKPGAVHALDDVSFSVKDREFFSIVGPSGCGKSTLLRVLARLIEQTDGSFEIKSDGDDCPENSMVFQEDALFPWRSVRRNVEFGLEMRGVDGETRRDIARSYLEKVGLADFESAYPHELSGGMKQRVNIARAFANDPEVLLMDEPLGALDAQTRHVLQEELMNIWNNEEKTVVYITHSLEEAILMSDRIGLMTSRPGHLKDTFTVDIPRPRTHENRNSEAFNDLYATLWESLKEEVQTSMQLQRSEAQ